MKHPLVFISLIFPVAVLCAEAIPGEELPIIIPQPREINLAGEAVPFPPERTQILLCTEHPVVRAGLEILQRAIREIGGSPCEVVVPEDGVSDNVWRIILGTHDSPLIKRHAREGFIPTEAQGYAIDLVPKGEKLRDGGIILLAGNDPQGALYAAVTFKRLLFAREGKVLLLPARVRDWPDYKFRILDEIRSIALPPKNEAEQPRTIARIKEYIEKEMVEHKVNGLYLSPWLFGSERDESLIEAVRHRKHEWLKEVLDFAHARGIAVAYFASSAVGSISRHENDPRFNDLMRLKGEFHTWGDDELLRLRFTEVGKALAHFGIDIVFVHHADTTDENWPNRSARDQARFGDDRVAADANLINIYHRTLREHLSRALIFATVHPYSPGCLRRGQYHREFLERLGRAIPNDVGILLREGSRDEYAQFHAYYQGRAFAVYHEIFHAILEKGTVASHNKIFTSCQPRLVKSFYFPHPHSTYFNPWSWGKVNRLITAQYVWNINSPGSAETFNYKESLSEFDGDNQTVYKKMLPLVVRELYGSAHAAELAAFHSLPFRPAWLALPLHVKRQSRQYLDEHGLKNVAIPDEIEQLQEQIEAGNKGVELMDSILADVTLSPNLRSELERLRRFALLFKYLGPPQLNYVRANRLAEEGKKELARPLLAEGRKLLETARQIFAKESVEGTSWVSCGLVDGRRSVTVWQNNFIDKIYAKRFEELEKALEAGVSAAEETVSEETLKQVRGRIIRCVRPSEKILLDGMLSEPSWAAAPKVAPFVRIGKNRAGRAVYPEAQTEASFLYDENGLYIGIVCFEPHTDSMSATAKRRDDLAIFRDDAIEIFFMPSPQMGKYCQLVFNVGGERLDMIPIPRENEIENYLRWNPEWQVKTSVQSERSWTAEVFLPWALFLQPPFDVVQKPPGRGAVWKVFLGRSRRQLEHSGVTWVNGFHDRDLYPTLAFE